MKLSRINKIAYIGWRGIDYEEICLDGDVLTGLTGATGAGKSTLAICLGYALLPDKKVLNIRPISEVQDPQEAGLDYLGSLVNSAYGYSYVALDITSRDNERLIAGIHVSLKDGRGEFKRWYIKAVSKDLSLQEIMRSTEGDDEYYPDLPELSKNLAKRPLNPLVVKYAATVGEYGSVLYDAGILPTDLTTSAERGLYAKLIETTFKGGISNEVSERLKEYLLPEARRLSDLVSKLQECSDDVLKTRRFLKDANLQLDVIESIYGAGKRVVLNALKRLTVALADQEANRDGLRVALAEKNERLHKISGDPERLEQEINAAETNASAKIKNNLVLLNILNNEYDVLFEKKNGTKAAEEDAYKKRESFRNAQKFWLKIAGGNSDKTFEWFREFLEAQATHAHDEVLEIDRSIKLLNEEKASLSRSADIQSEHLARMMGGQSLGEIFNGLSEKEAIAAELALGGITSGVVDCAPADLEDIEANDDVPEVFWIGKNAPQVPEIITSGDWLLCSNGSGGFTVFSKNRMPVFGAKAREARILEIDGTITSLTNKRIKAQTEETNALKERDNLMTNSNMVEEYMKDRSAGERLDAEWFSAQKAKERTNSEFIKAKDKRAVLQLEVNESRRPYQKEIDSLKEAKLAAEQELKSLMKDITELSLVLKQAEANYDALRGKMDEAERILASEYGKLSSEASLLSAMTENSYGQSQTQDIISLAKGLADEPPARIAAIQDVSSNDEVSYVRLWPVLCEVLKDRVPAEVLDDGGVDMLDAMRARRFGLDAKLKEQEDVFKINAKNIHHNLRQDIHSKRTELKRLSRLGQDLCFGNITGIRISAAVHEDILDLVQEFSTQGSMFTKDVRPVDEVLAEFINAQSSKKMTGQDLLDYRSYMDLHLEIRRKGSDWKRASSLSGGESIGCGLAIGIMLARSLMARGDLKPNQITPLFILDEVMRLDADGQKTVIEFGRKEGFQVFVTADKLSPKYACTVYALSRVYEPKEQLIIRWSHTKGQEALQVC